MTHVRSALVSLTVGGLFLGTAAGCREEEAAPPGEAAPSGEGEGEGETAGISEQARQEARQIFDSRCVPCHGAQGGGDGPAAAALSPRPRDFRLDEWQQSVTDEHIERIIVYGGAAVGKSPTMPANPDLQPKPEVVAALREHVRSLGQ